MDFIDEVIDLIRKETAIGGNRRERIANALQLLRDNSNNFKEPASVSRGKLSMRTDGENLYFTDSQNKEQEVILSDEFRASVNTGITGTAELNTVPSATKYERWKISMPGTYPNFIEKDSNGNNVPVTITPKEFEENEITLSVTNGIAKKEFSKKLNSKVETWTAKAFEKGRQVFHNSIIFEANTDTTETDIPGVEIPNTPSKWDIKLIGFNVSESTNIVTLASKNGVDLLHVDSEGYTWAMFYPNSIPVESITGLRDFLDELDPGYFKVVRSTKVLSITDSNNSVLISIQADGSVYIPKLKVDGIPDEVTAINEVTAETYIALGNVPFVVLDFEIVPPINADEVNSGIVRFKVGEIVLLTAKCKLQPQGQGSMAYAKKGYTLDLFNRYDKKLAVKLNNLPALDSYHLKAYFTDSTKSKDIFGARVSQLLTSARPYPENMFKTVTTAVSPTFDITRYSADSKFSLDGVPSEMRIQGTFRGQYVLRLKKDKANYAINTSNQNHLLLDSQRNPVYLGSGSYANYEAVAVDYEVRSPKTPNATAKANIYRLFSYMQSISSGAQVFNGTYQNYMVLNAWIDWLIQAEVIGHWDNTYNNAMYVSYDGLLWSPCPIDMDLILGVKAGGKLANPDTGFYMGNNDIWPKFRAQLHTEIAARYAYLRGTVLKKENLASMLKGVSANWPQATYEAELKKWGCITLPEALDTIDNCINFMSFRLNWLDTQFV